jgi:phosphoglycolate phosphatase-like HAD superfamily hydrolase
LGATVVLFDVDGTLVDCGGAGRHALESALSEIAAIEGGLEGIALGGMTDHAIVREALGRLGRAPEPPLVAAILARYLAILEEALARWDRFRVLPGARHSVLRARARGWAVGLGTGNVREGAMLKLARGALSDLFDFGGFGCDAHARADVLRFGIDRGARILGVSPRACGVVVVGDTVRDVEAALAVGATPLAVATGRTEVDDLRRAGAALAVASLEDPEATAFFERFATA